METGMKKIVILLAMAAAAIACTKESKAPVSAKGTTLLSGEFISSRIALGDKNGDTYPALWEEGDAIAVYNASTEALIGTATVAAASVGSQTGSFVLNAGIADGTSIKVVYPAGEGYRVDAEQSKVSAADKHLATRAESAVVQVSGGTASFALSHPNAIVKVDVSSSEFSGKLLKSVSLYSAGAAISADGDYARVTYSNPSAISADGTVSAVFMTLPVETNTDFYVAVKLVDPSDSNKMVCIPKKFEGKQLQGGKVNKISFASLATSDNAVAWYNPVCNRYIPEGGWCYGESSTVWMLGAANTSVNFDVRAVGDFLDVIRYAKEPKQMQLRTGDIVNTGNAGVWSVDGTAPSKGKYASLASLQPTIKLDKAVSSLSSKHCVHGFWNLCDASGGIIWAYMFWATEVAPSATAYVSGDVMNMNLGGYKGDGSAAEQRGAHYQWGRPFPFGYGDDEKIQVTNTSLRVSSYKMSAENAASIACVDDGTDTPKDWWFGGGHKYDLWGNPEISDTSTGGVKSIFDPCPKGWKVASAAVIKEVCDNAEFDSTNKWFTYKGDVWPITYFRNGSTAKRGGSGKALYWASNARNDNHGQLLEFSNDGTIAIKGTWRANACAVRCMKDTDNR